MVHQGLAWHVPARPCAFSGEVRRGRAPTHHLAPTRVPCAPSTRCAPRYRPASTLAISPARCSCGHCSCVTPRHHPSRPPSRRACRPSRAATPPASCSHPATRASCSHPARPLPPRTKTRPYLAPISLRLARRPRFAPFCLPPVRLPRAVIISCGPSAAHKNPPSPPREIKTHFFGTYARLYAGGGGISRE